jgi:hypothetical protein
VLKSLEGRQMRLLDFEYVTGDPQVECNLLTPDNQVAYRGEKECDQMLKDKRRPLDGPKMMDILVITLAPARRVSILRQFLESHDDENVVLKAIKACFHTHSPKQRLLVGMSHRNAKPSYPQFYQVIQAQAVQSRTMTIPNMDVVDVTNLISNNVDAAVRLTVNCDLEAKVFHDYIGSMGYKPEEIYFAYPETTRRMAFKSRVEVSPRHTLCIGLTSSGSWCLSPYIHEG